MPDAEKTKLPFVMYGARAALSDGLAHVEEQVKALERAVIENPGLAFDLARTLVESTCRTILSERRQSHTPNDDLPKLFKAVNLCLPILPPAATGDAGARKSLSQTLSGLSTALQGVCELRNACGFASHGADGPRPALEGVQAMLAAQAADALVGFLHATHRQDQRVHKEEPLRYEGNKDFNDYVDNEYGQIQIFDLSYQPSEVLFLIDRQAYYDALNGYKASMLEETGDDAPSAAMEGGT